VADQFLLSIRLTRAPRFDALLRDVASNVLEQAGYTSPAAAEILGVFCSALERSSAEAFRECDAAFRTEGGQLVIVVSYADGREWRLTRALPSPD
jgi:hypothetical protein